MDKVTKTEEEWKEELPSDVYHVTREGETEAPFSGKYHASKDKGVYKCSNCGTQLFSSDTKFDSGTGWPSFYEPMEGDNIEYVPDDSLGPPSPSFGGASMQRTKVRCKSCGAHLGHVFDDGPKVTPEGKPCTGKRYCINSLSLDLDKKE